mmetsp:Transcript_16622/g.23979  ORF Transcript_16622/g.23979 Transcript_16622/m.23979 type:complete len:120 (+) Transcript_16622:987-1346(+)
MQTLLVGRELLFMTRKQSAEHQPEDMVLKGWMSRPVLTVIDSFGAYWKLNQFMLQVVCPCSSFSLSFCMCLMTLYEKTRRTQRNSQSRRATRPTYFPGDRRPAKAHRRRKSIKPQRHPT